MEKLKVTLVQSDIIGNDPKANIAVLDDILQPIDTDGVIVLPETFATGFSANPILCAETENGTTFKWMKETAARKNCALCGSLIMSNEGKSYNAFVWMNPDGKHVVYNKRHVFTMGEEMVEKGSEQVVIDYKGWKIRPFICYDLRFPVWIRNKLIGNVYKYDIAVFVANWPKSRINVWKTLLPARAIENMVYTVGVNCVGTDGNGVFYNGQSMVCDPKGRVVAKTKSASTETITLSIDKEKLESFRAKFGVAHDWDNFKLI